MNQKVLLQTKITATLVAGVYAFFGMRAVRALSDGHQLQVRESMPVIAGIAYAFCVFFFLMMQRETKNIFEKIAAFTSAGAFVPPLVRLVCTECLFVPPVIFSSLYLDTILIVAATIAVAVRTIEIWRVAHPFAGRRSL